MRQLLPFGLIQQRKILGDECPSSALGRDPALRRQFGVRFHDGLAVNAEALSKVAAPRQRRVRLQSPPPYLLNNGMHDLLADRCLTARECDFELPGSKHAWTSAYY